MADSPSSAASPVSPTVAAVTTSKQAWHKRITSHASASDVTALAAAIVLLAAISFLTVGLRNSAFTSAADPAPSSAATFLTGFATPNALKHLSAITQSEHPLPSRANWAVRDYLIAQLNTLAASPNGRERKVEVITPTPWISYPQGDALRILAPTASGGAVFLQSSNVYFRIPGRNELEKGDRTSLLLSAHYDSVPTSKGVGDDGLGIAALIELARVALESEPLAYSLVFNLNNGEELGLYGAHELVRHPLWKDLAAFINIDSVCPTGRPLLYRATSREMIEIFQQNAPYPHASVLGQELMNAGLIRSDTDFSVYWRAGVTGVDFAFYDRRWVYHTDLDNASLLQPESLSLLGHNVASLMHGINKTGIQHIRRTPEPRNVVYTDTVGRSMFVIPYWGLATLAFIMSAIFLLVPIGVRTALKAKVKSLRAGSRALLGVMPLTGGAVQLRRWAMSTLAALGALVLILAGTVGIVLIVLSIQPMAVSGRPTGVFALAILACLFMPALIAAATRRWTRNGRINLHHGVLGLWLILLPLVGVASMSTAFFVHVFWFGLAYISGTLGLEVANWVSVVRFGHADRVGSANAASPTEQSALLRRSNSSAASNEAASPVSASSPAIAEAAPSPSDLGIPSLLVPLRSTWSQCLLFAISSIVPFMVALDFAFVYVYGMGFAIQEGLSPAILAGFFTLFIFPLSLNIVPLLSSLPARVIRTTTALLFLAVVILGLVLTASFPFTPDAPVKLTLRISSAFNAVLDRANATSASASPIAFARSSADAQVTLGDLPQQPTLDTSLLVRDAKPDACTQHACTYSAAKLGHANLPYPTANFSIQQAVPTPGEPGAATLVTITAPASLVFCTIGGLPASKLAGARVLVSSSSSSASDPPANATLALAAPEFRLIASNPLHTLTAQLVAPRAWAAHQWTLACRFMANDDADGFGSRVHALYRDVLTRVPPYVSVTFASMGGGRALMVAEYTVIVPAVGERGVGAGGEAEGAARLSARGVWELFRGLFD